MGVAFFYRRLLTRPVFVGVTGSLGKTQLKNAIAVVLSRLGAVKFDPGTDNRTYDAAKNLLQVRQSHAAVVQEIGMAGPNTMARPVRLYRPDIAVITVIRSDHSADFASRHEHVLEKAAIIRNLPAGGWAILNADEPNLRWFGFVDELLNLCSRLHIETIITLGSMYDHVLHTDRILSGTASNAELSSMFSSKHPISASIFPRWTKIPKWVVPCR